MSTCTFFTFNRVGLQTSVQDMGRTGYQHLGVPVGGAMDKSSAAIANALVGNAPGTPVLEITLTGPEIEVEGDCQIAITGADISPSINGLNIPMYETVSVKSGAVLAFGRLQSGCRAYLAVGGVWQVTAWLGSSSAALYYGQELTPDSFIKKESKLGIQVHPSTLKKSYPKAALPEFNGNAVIQVLPGPEFKEFSGAALHYLLHQSHRISKDSNRMGYRLEGTVPDFTPGRELISSGSLPGTIQITGSGQPVILMADAQTTGGYFRFGNVTKADINKLAQLKPGDALRFSLMDDAKGYAALKQ